MTEVEYKDRTSNNLVIIILVVLISAILSFYTGTKFSGFDYAEVDNLTNTIGQIEEKLISQNATINALNSEIENLKTLLSDYSQIEELYSLLNDEYEYYCYLSSEQKDENNFFCWCVQWQQHEFYNSGFQ